MNPPSLSDLALPSLCRCAAIPIPGRGYWQRTEAARPVEPTPLEVPPKGLPELLRIRGTKAATSSRVRSLEIGEDHDELPRNENSIGTSAMAACATPRSR